MSYPLSKPPLFSDPKEWINLFLVCGALFILSIGWRYMAYRHFVSEPKRFVDADVLYQYTKHKKGRSYEVIKVESDTVGTFYTTSKEPLKNLKGRRVDLMLFPKKLTFLDYLQTPYIPAVVLRVRHDRSLRMRLFEMVASQHADRLMQELYGALFFALPISKTLRHQVAMLGINHLLALSGFHLGLLWAIVYGVSVLFYRPLQARYFPWRHRLADVGLWTVIVLGGYVVLTGFVPSLLRAYVMVVIGWLALLLGIELLSFEFLALCVMLLVALFPSLLGSIGFWLSVWGVFFIYLFLRYTRHWPRWAIFLGLNGWVYVMMLPVVHLFFPLFSLHQLLSVPLTMAFTLFYPLSILLHLVGWGDGFDGGLQTLLAWGVDGEWIRMQTPLWLGIGFGLLSLLATRFKAAAIFAFLVACGFLVVLIEQVA